MTDLSRIPTQEASAERMTIESTGLPQMAAEHRRGVAAAEHAGLEHHANGVRLVKGALDEALSAARSQASERTALLTGSAFKPQSDPRKPGTLAAAEVTG